ncbi:hypothetical protein M5362_26370 [Streptomyces sp. Je 1-79]|uniref:hypothetical protein n=1 Tax=Streptomyces sp. Je 1-79 TaxID=2943847 RepID=UPI0021A280D8|nr:hypothetical protein [Streptomyces sp. Je 1-79]MCT4356657.1 hypothetical protein [Streptomyces sp. Je 1-79]
MQPPAVPDLAHTHARPVHWLATATAMAAVVAFAGLLQPGPATATTAAASGSAPAAPRPAPDATTADYPLECGGAPVKIAQRVTGDLDGDGKPETVAVVHCEAGSGTPPHALYVLTHAKDGPGARVVATLVEPARQKNVADLAVRDGAVTATLLGYSSPDVPSCCPDERERVSWSWKGGTFVRAAQADARSV